MNKKLKKIGALILSGLVIGGAGFGLGYSLNKEKIVEKEVQIEVPVEVQVEKIVELNKTIEVPVEKIVYKDNENLQKVLDFIYKEDGNLTLITKDLKEKEINQIVDRIILINDFKSLSLNKIRLDGTQLLHKENVTLNNNQTIKLYKSDIKRFKVFDDYEDVIIDSIDFDEKDAEVIVKAKFEQDDYKFNATFIVEFKDYEIKDVDIQNITQV